MTVVADIFGSPIYVYIYNIPSDRRQVKKTGKEDHVEHGQATRQPYMPDREGVKGTNS